MNLPHYQREPGPENSELAELLRRVSHVSRLPAGTYRADCPVCEAHSLLITEDREKPGGALFLCKTDWGGKGDCAPLVMPVLQQREPPAASPEWEPLVPFGTATLPPFPTDALPGWVRAFVEAEAARTQTPPDLAGMLALAALATAVATTHEVGCGSGWREPLNLFVLIALPPASRKSAVFRSVMRPLTEYEQAENAERGSQIAASKTERDLIEGRLEKAKKQAVASGAQTDREEAEDTARHLAEELDAFRVLAPLRLTADDVTPEKLASLLVEQQGRIALLSPEGDAFDMIAGRYTDKTPNFGVYLKGHAGDALRVDRVGRAAEYISRPALTMGLAVQPDVLQGLAAKPGFRGRGLLGRFLFSLPASNIGQRAIVTAPMPEAVGQAYHDGLRCLLQLAPAQNEEGEFYPVLLSLAPDAQALFQRFAQTIETLLQPEGELSGLTDWGGKLAGATARLAGVLHLAEFGGARREIGGETLRRAILLANYLTEHAKAAYADMGADAEIEGAQRLLAWIRRTRREHFTRRQAHQALQTRFPKAAQLDRPLALLIERGYLRQQDAAEEGGAGRPSGPIYLVNPAIQNIQNIQNC